MDQEDRKEDVGTEEMMPTVKFRLTDGIWYLRPIVLIGIAASAYLAVMIMNMMRIRVTIDQLGFIHEIPLARSLGLWVMGCFLLYGVYRWLNRESIVYLVLSALVMLFALILIWEAPKNIYLTLGVMCLVGVFYIFVRTGTEEHILRETLSPRVYFGLLCGGFVVMVVTLSLGTLWRYWSFGGSAFDLGIFTQMFEYMKETGLATTTIERNRELSHFAVHFSPFYYVLLPFYWLAPRPETLLVLQAIAVASVCFPVYQLARHFKLTEVPALLLGLAAMALPGIISPIFFDFHENKFLAVSLLWLFYFYENRGFKRMFLMLALVLSIKEDAAIYVAIFGAFVALERKEWRLGGVIFSIAIAYFIAVTSGMNAWGEGIMDERFSNYHLENEQGLLTVFKNIALNPMYFVYSLFNEKKVQYILYIFMPLLFMPLVTLQWRRYLLLLPLVINLMTTYPYQYEIGFQYTYAIMAFYLYLTIMNLSDLPAVWQRRSVALMLTFAIALSITTAGGTFVMYKNIYNENRTKIVETNNALATIPIGPTVGTDTYFAPQLFRQPQLYLNPTDFDPDYLVIDLRQEKEALEARLKLFEEKGYQLHIETGHTRILKKP